MSLLALMSERSRYLVIFREEIDANGKSAIIVIKNIGNKNVVGVFTISFDEICGRRGQISDLKISGDKILAGINIVIQRTVFATLAQTEGSPEIPGFLSSNQTVLLGIRVFGKMFFILPSP